MKELRLSLKSKWFEMTKVGIKYEDYREVTPYWCSRLYSYWYPSESENPLDWIIKFKDFNINTMTLGYPKSDDTKRIIKFKHAGIEIRTGDPLLGAEEGKFYFVIKHGEKLETT